jgi:hypothetical protein
MKKQLMPAICIRLKPSYQVLGCYLGISTLSSIAILQVDMPIIAKILLILICNLMSFYVILRDALLVLPWSWQRVEVSSHGELKLVNQDQKTFQLQLSVSTFNHPYLTVLNFKHFGRLWGRQHSLVLTRWQVDDTQQYRQMRVWLKWWPHQIAYNATEDLMR